MTTQKQPFSQPWTAIGGPPAGSVAAIAIGQDGGTTVFIGTGVGLVRSKDWADTRPVSPEALPEWERLSNAPLGMMCLAVSPNYAKDQTLLAGTSSGISFSRDGGESWLAARLPLSSSMILALCFSPNYLSDSIVLAGTLEDGIFISDTGGERWSNRSYGLLDSTVYSLVLSPDFARDGTIFAGTETTLYYSYNSARAWKLLPFPEEAAPVLSLGISPGFARNGTVYAGTEQSGLYRSTDRGQSWQKVDLPAASVNDLLITGNDTLLAATGAGIFQSNDQGITWKCLMEMPNVLNLGMQGDLLLAGLAEQGVWMRWGQGDWAPLSNLSTRSFLGLLISEHFERDGLAFMIGLQEGIWKTQDGGRTWEDLTPALPTSEVYALAAGPSGILAAASAAGLLLSQDAGLTWQLLVEGSSTVLAFSPNGKILAAGFPGEGIRTSVDLGKTWKNIPGPWQAGGRVIGLSVSDLGHYTVAYLEGIAETASLWQGKAGSLEKVLSQTVRGNPLLSLWMPPGPAADRPWYASLGNRVWTLSARSGDVTAESMIFPQDQGENILSLTGTQGPNGLLLLACTGRRLYQSKDGQAWRLAHDFGSERAVSISISPSYASNKAVYALLLGGKVCKGTIQ